MLFRVWTHEMHRQTVDLDLLSYGDPSTERLRRIFEDICAVSVEPDGLEFLKESITVTAIREDDEYHGQRVVMQGKLEKMRIPLQVDIGFGDAVHVEQLSEYPTLLDFPAPQIRMYPKEHMISEKLHAMVILADRNSRMKDFDDLWFMSRQFSFEGPVLIKAIIQTFDRRKTPLPQVIPAALLKTFSENPLKAAQWQSFVKRNRLEQADRSLGEIIVEVGRFLVPPLLAATKEETFDLLWPPGGPWAEKEKGCD
jgi:hypothetical protein